MLKQYLIAILVVAALAVLSVLLSPVTSTLEQQALDLKYALRGEIEADTNVVILYFDNDDIAALGGGSLRRNYYALVVDVLTFVGASAIGIDAHLGERQAEYPEYDDLLARRVERSGRVVLSCYFPQLNSQSITPRSDELPQRFRYPVLMPGESREQLQLPLAEFLVRAAGVGHTNVAEVSENDIPLFIACNGFSVPAFSVELLRVHQHSEPSHIQVAGNKLTFGDHSTVRIPFKEGGRTSVMFPGTLASFKAYRCVEVLRAFERQRKGLTSRLDVAALKGKIVLVGIIGEGRSNFVGSPFTSSYPSIAVQGAVIDNALNNRFLVEPEPLVNSGIAFVLGLIGVLLTLRVSVMKGIISTLIVFLAYASASYFIFEQWHYTVPLVQPLFVVFFAVIVAVALEHRIVKNKVVVLESEKALVDSELRAKELKVQMLERELLDKIDNASQRDSQLTMRLAEEINRYKKDISVLSSRVTDFVKYEFAEPRQKEGPGLYEEILYDRSGKMSEVVKLVEKIAASDANVLILGESGTGKELVAHAIHHRSKRVSKPFVAINCGAIPETLLESELFGHEKGAFTGAVQEKAGRFEYADGGTIFLDEVAETSEAFQVKLLRVVQHGEFERVGSSVTKEVNVRILAATNKDVKSLLREKGFREDLYYRLNVFTVQLPTLRERKSDIPLLAKYFLKRTDEALSVSSSVMDAFLQYSWPGNVRELESAVQRAAILAKADDRTLIRLKDIPEEVAAVLHDKIQLEDQILELLREKRFSRSSISETAQELGGLHRGTVAEYFRGTCFRYFLESGWDVPRAVRLIASSANSDSNTRVTRKLIEYLQNAVEDLPTGVAFEEVQPNIKSKYKNLPQRYHPVLNEVIRAYLQGKWSLDSVDR
ncbi:MAG: sigma 54-interacting transcriptional regulator [Ignavibacteriae bacterium]|nr:sigma 54-interacting transcriptional regulator [Ignavibacteriota bacterium]